MKKKNKNFDNFDYQSKVIKNPKSYVGRTYKINDDDLPHTNKDSGKIVNVAAIEQNEKGEIVVSRLTTQETKNAKKFKSKHRLYKGYKTFAETQFQNKDYITPSDSRLEENPWINNLTRDNLNEMRKTIYLQSKQAQSNVKKVNKWKKRK